MDILGGIGPAHEERGFTMIPFGIAGVQMQVSAHADNVSVMKRKVAELTAFYPWVQMVVFSELAPLGASLANAQPIPGPLEETFRTLAARHKVWLIPGSFFERDGDRIYNTALVINPAGEVVGRYRKMFPFYPYEDGTSAGDQFLVFDVPDVGRFGVMICYDLWFPEMARTLAVMGAEVILQPTMTTTIDRELELCMLRANAAMNQCYLWGINGAGAGGVGRSMVCSPEGRILHEAGSSEETFALEVDFDLVRYSRQRGLLRLGQVLKSFRDAPVSFDVYQPGVARPFLESLGPLHRDRR